MWWRHYFPTPSRIQGCKLQKFSYILYFIGLSPPRTNNNLLYLTLLRRSINGYVVASFATNLIGLMPTVVCNHERYLSTGEMCLKWNEMCLFGIRHERQEQNKNIYYSKITIKRLKNREREREKKQTISYIIKLKQANNNRYNILRGVGRHVQSE